MDSETHLVCETSRDEDALDVWSGQSPNLQLKDKKKQVQKQKQGERPGNGRFWKELLKYKRWK